MKTSRLLLACSLCPALAAASASATLLDDFESYVVGSVKDNAPANTVWSTNGSGLPIIQAQSGNQFLTFDWSSSGYRGAYRDLGAGIGASDTSTVFFRFRSTDETGDDAIGVTDLDTPNTSTAGFPSFRAGINMVDDGNTTNGTYNLKAGATTLATGLAEGTWYNAWLVIDNATNTMDVYLNNGYSEIVAADKINTSPVAFINGTANALDRFVVSGGLGAQQKANVDDINLDAGDISTTAVYSNTRLFFDDFENYSANTDIDTSGRWGTANATAGFWTVEDESTATPFGAGPNQFGNLNDSSASASIRLQSPSLTEAVNAVTTFSFDFSEPTGGGDSNLIVGYSTNGDDLNGTGSRQTINLNNGTITGLASVASDTYDLDTAYTLYMIYNDSGSDVNYDGGTITNGDAHIWIEELDSGNFIFVGTSSEQNPGTVATSYRVGFRSFSTFVQAVQIDNVELTLGAAAVPEPASLALLGLGGLLLTRRRR